MDDLRARFNARIAMHVRDGWEVVHIHDHAPDRLEALLTKTAIGQPRATGRGVTEQRGSLHRYCRRILARHDGTNRVSTVGCPPELSPSPPQNQAG